MANRWLLQVDTRCGWPDFISDLERKQADSIETVHINWVPTGRSAVWSRQQAAEDPISGDENCDTDVLAGLELHETCYFVLISVAETFFVHDTVSQRAHTMLKVKLWQQNEAKGLSQLLLLFPVSELLALTFLVLVNELFAFLLELPSVSYFIRYEKI